MKEQYLGDSVYARQTDFGDIEIYTNNGNGPENLIVLDPMVLYALQGFITGTPKIDPIKKVDNATELQPPSPV